MAYALNILPTSAAFYTLQGATISGGIMSLNAGGSAKYTIAISDVATLTETMRLSLVPGEPTDSYVPKLYVKVTATSVEDESFSYVVFPNGEAGIAQNFILNFSDDAYTLFTFEVFAIEAATLQLWELCPEAAADVQTIIDGVEQSLPHLLYDYNMAPVVVEQLQQTIALITFNLQGNTDISGHLAVTCISSAQCTLTLRFFDLGTQELYSPMLYDLRVGLNTIGVPHAYLTRYTGLHTTYVTAQVSEGRLTIGTRGCLYSIDAGYLAERIIDMGAAADDLTIEQSGASKPEFVWASSHDNGNCLVRRIEYDVSRAKSFEPMYDLGPAKLTAIEFNGQFVPDTVNEGNAYTLQTEDSPWLFWIDPDDNLVAQRGTDGTTRRVLDTGVSFISACRGYSAMSEDWIANDQGLICAYIKSGVVKYWQYDYLDGAYSWHGPFNLDNTIVDANATQVHRLNDYRVGIAVTTPTQNLWYVSTRTYVEQAAKSEHAYRMLNSVLFAASIHTEVYEEATLSTYALEDEDAIIVSSDCCLVCNTDITGLCDCTTIACGSTTLYPTEIEQLNERTLKLKLPAPLYATYTVTLPTGHLFYEQSFGGYQLLQNASVTGGASIVHEHAMRVLNHSNLSILARPIQTIVVTDLDSTGTARRVLNEVSLTVIAHPIQTIEIVTGSQGTANRELTSVTLSVKQYDAGHIPV